MEWSIRAGPVGQQHVALMVALLAASLHWAAALSPVDPCAVIGQRLSDGGVVSVSSSLSCLDSFKWDKATSKKTLATVTSVVTQLYVFSDLARRYTERHLPSKLDLLRELHHIAKAKWQTERGFHTALYRTFAKLQDAHTYYYSNCFSSIAWVHSFPIITVLQGQKQVVKIIPHATAVTLPTVVHATEVFMKAKLSDFENATVLKIDGHDPIKYLLRLANTLRIGYRNVNTRYNLLNSNIQVSGPSSVAVQDVGYFASREEPPPNNSFNLTLLRAGKTEPITITVPWWSLYVGQNNFSSAASFYAANCAKQVYPEPATTSTQSPTTATASALADSKEAADLLTQRPATMAKGMIRKWKGRKVTAGASTLSHNAITLVKGGFLQFYGLDATTAVMLVPDFEGPEGNSTAWLEEFVTGIRTLKTHGFTKLILDLSDNPGGYLYLGYSAVNYLFPRIVPELPTLFRASPLLDLVVNASTRESASWSNFYWGSYAANSTSEDGINTNSFTSPAGFYYPPQVRNYGNVVGNYSSFVLDVSFRFVDQPPSTPPPFSAQNIIVLTNGDCASTCAIVASSLSQKAGVRTAAAGGLTGNSAPFSGVAGGQAYTLGDFLDTADRLVVQFNPLVPERFAQQVEMGFTLRAAFDTNLTYPLEFTYLPATYHLPYTEATALSRAAVWRQVAALF